MNGSTKILTVSYGTFSCTLEGFDDPLGTMQDIAEYFRDLAGDDRYFGAEPPTPDVEMLQNIAQKEVNRRVEAQVSETGVALRQVEKQPETAEIALPGGQPDEKSKVEDGAVIAARVVSVVAASMKEAKETAPRAHSAEVEDNRGPLAFDDEYLLSDEPEDVLAVDPDAHFEADGPAETVAEKLRRIRAVVSRNVEQGDSPNVISEEQVQDAAIPNRDRALTETIERITADLSDDEEAPVLEITSEDDEPKNEAVADEPAKASDFEDMSDDSAAMIAVSEHEDLEDLAALDTPSKSSVPASEILADAPARVEDSSDDLVLDEYIPEETGPYVSGQAETEPVSANETNASDDDEEEFEDEEQADSVEVTRTMSQIISSVTVRSRDFEPDDGVLKLEDAIASDRPSSLTLTPKPEGDVGRLLAEADTKLNDDDVVRRRRVISQMRAAVAATKADRLVSRQVSKEETEEADKIVYRADLSEAVSGSKPRPDKNEPRPAVGPPPLVLVSSQRVDDGGQTPASVQPKMPQPDSERTPGGFAAFAQDVGATGLPDLLEAAAAFTMFSEGQSSFTRPEIMKRAARVDPTIRMSREDSLRSFGQLLRQGKFKKLERGQFIIDEDTRFNPGQRIAGE